MTTTASPETARGLSDRVAAVRAVHRSGRTRDYEWRDRQLEGLARLVTEREDEIALALQRDLGRTRVEAWMGDISPTEGEIAYARKHLRRWMRRRRQPLPLNQLPASGWVQYEPLGTVLVIGPWNYPVYLALAPLVAALAAGNCAVVKPSELAPVTSALMAELIPQYVDPEAVIVVEGDGAISQELLALGLDHVLFTGGTEVGKKIMAAAAPTLTPVTLELGGKSPVFVCADTDLEVAARRIAWVKLLNSGQTCIAPDYVLVDERVREEFVSLLVRSLTDFLADRPEPGLRIVNERQHARLTAYLEQTSGTVLTGGVSDVAALTLTPSVVVDPSWDDDLMTEEIFGPILPVLSYSSLEEAAALVTDRDKPLALYAFTSSRESRDLLLDVPAGGTVFNHVAMHCLVPQLPFGGVGASGTGAYHGEWGFQALSHRKSVLAKRTWPDPSFVYPPYTDKALRLLRKVL